MRGTHVAVIHEYRRNADDVKFDGRLELTTVIVWWHKVAV